MVPKRRFKTVGSGEALVWVILRCSLHVTQGRHVGFAWWYSEEQGIALTASNTIVSTSFFFTNSAKWDASSPHGTTEYVQQTALRVRLQCGKCAAMIYCENE